MSQELLNYKTFGDLKNQGLLIIHGLFGSLDNWLTLAKAWSSEYYVITIDVRNHGKSFHSNDMAFESINEDIKRVLQKENILNTSIIGHSMGGKIAMEFAAKYPENVNKLIIADVAPFPYEPHHRDIFEMMDAIDLSLFNSRNEIEKEIKKFIIQEGVVQFILKNIKRNEESLIFEWKFNQKVLKENYLYLIQRVVEKGFNGNVLFIGGEHSKYVTKETSEKIFELYPNVEIDFVSNAGHWLHADNPKEFYAKVSTFLSKI